MPNQPMTNTTTRPNRVTAKAKNLGLTVSVSQQNVDQAQGINSLAKAGQAANSGQMKVMAGEWLV